MADSSEQPRVSATPLLDSILSPADVRSLPDESLAVLADEVRRELLEVIDRTGGHLASNLGVVELTIALLRVFDPERDVVVWDTSHQGYTWKLLTGRREVFRKLRQTDGCCGFLHPRESPYDFFAAGHAGTAISAALGFAAARDRRGERGRRKVVAVVGDGALNSGVALEGLNSIIETTRDFILVLNDNRMSIAPNVGAIARYLNRIITGAAYNRYKRMFRELVLRIPRVGPPLRQLIHRVEEATKSLIVPGRWFEELGLRYIGPLDGHDVLGLVRTFEAVRSLDEQPIVLHVLTRKGFGFAPAEESPEDFHSIAPGAVSAAVGSAEGTPPADSARTQDMTFSRAFGLAMCRRIERDERVVAITAGMCMGTGLRIIRERAPQRLYDVGIAEEHAVVFAAGLAAAGFRPVVAIYATFMQRAVDYVFHDVCLQNLPVVFCLDRAGIVDDGPTHHGIQDLGIWRSFPHLAILAPADAWELEAMLEQALERAEPVMLRYPKGKADVLAPTRERAVEWGRAAVLRDGQDVAIWALGRETVVALDAAARLADEGIDAAVVDVRFVEPFDEALLREQARRMPIVTLEDHCVRGGLGAVAAEHLDGRLRTPHLARGWPLEVLPWGAVEELRRRYRLDAESLAEDIRRFLENPGESACAPDR